jgi:hypothetical protein
MPSSRPCGRTAFADRRHVRARERGGPGQAACYRVRRRGAWRSLVSALVWGTRGPEFKSRRPDRRNPLDTAGFFVAVVEGGRAFACLRIAVCVHRCRFPTRRAMPTPARAWAASSRSARTPARASMPLRATAPCTGSARLPRRLRPAVRLAGRRLRRDRRQLPLHLRLRPQRRRDRGQNRSRATRRVSERRTRARSETAAATGRTAATPSAPRSATPPLVPAKYAGTPSAIRGTDPCRAEGARYGAAAGMPGSSGSRRRGPVTCGAATGATSSSLGASPDERSPASASGFTSSSGRFSRR